MKKILFATGNETKSKRFSKGLEKESVELISLKDININLEINENGKNAIENALIKARAYYNKAKMITMAMDDSLYIEDIPEELQPGLFVRRINGKRLNDEEMIKYYSGLAKKYGKNGKLTARWVYGLAIIKDEKEMTFTWNKEDFYIVSNPSEKIDPGYPLNTISINKKLNKYFTEMTYEDKELVKEDEQEVINFILNSIKE